MSNSVKMAIENDPRRKQDNENDEFRSENQIPPVLSDSEENDSDENEGNSGYELLPQNEPEPEMEDSPQTLEEILRQIEPSEQVQTMIQESQRNQVTEEVQERQAIFKDNQNDSIEMNKDRVETIRTAMAGFQLPTSAIPSWATNMSDADWQKMVSDKLNKK